MSHYSNYNSEQCLPKIGTLAIGTTLIGFKVSYGSLLSLHGKNYIYDEDGYGIAVELEGGDKNGLKLLATAQAEHLAFAAIKRIQLNNDSEGPRTEGHYVLLNLITDPARPKNTRKIIAFIAHYGGLFQDYYSNSLKSDEEVLLHFMELIKKNKDYILTPLGEDFTAIQETLKRALQPAS